MVSLERHLVERERVADFREAVERENIHNAFVFIRSNNSGYEMNMIMYLNSPLLDTDIIYAHDLGSRNVVAMSQFPGRTFYRYEVDFLGSWARSDIVYENMTRLEQPGPG